jgi:hypothetical protein
MINKKLVDQYSFRKVFTAVLRRFNIECDDANFKEYYTDFLKQINQVISAFNMEIKTAQCEWSTVSYFCLIRQCDTGCIGTLSLLYTPMELRVFRRVLELIIESDDGFVEYETVSYEVGEMFDNAERDAATQSMQTTKRPSQAEIRRIIERFIQDYWLVEVLGNAGHVTLHGRAIAELAQYIKQLYRETPDVLNSCAMCSSLLLSGLRCENCKCVTHRHCARNLLKKSNACWKCKIKFSEDVISELHDSIANAKAEFIKLTETGGS